MNDSSKKNKGGRPAKILTLDHIRQIELLAGYGLTDARIAHVIGVGVKTLYKNKDLREDVALALEKGRTRAEAVIGQALYKKAKDGDLGAIVWWEKTRAGRRDANDVVTRGQITNISYTIQTADGDEIGK